MSETISKGIKTSLIVSFLIGLVSFTYQSYSQMNLLFQSIEFQQKEIARLQVFLSKGERFVKADGDALVQQITRLEISVSNVRARLANIEDKKLLTRAEYIQFIEFLKIRFTLLDEKLDEIKLKRHG